MDARRKLGSLFLSVGGVAALAVASLAVALINGLPAMPALFRSSDTSAVVIVTPALGPSFGTAPAGTCTWKRPRSRAGSIPSSAACERT